MSQEITVNGVKYCRKDRYEVMRQNWLRALNREVYLLEKIRRLQETVDYDTVLIGQAEDMIAADDHKIQAYKAAMSCQNTLIDGLKAKNRTLQAIVDEAGPLVDMIIATLERSSPR